MSSEAKAKDRASEAKAKAEDMPPRTKDKASEEEAKAKDNTQNSNGWLMANLPPNLKSVYRRV